jgi:exodeoxyribonuclease-3
MRIVTWNINSLNARKDLAARFLDEEKPDVLALQELKLETDKVPRELFTSRGYEVVALGQKSWNGVLLAARSPVSEVVTGLAPADRGEARFIAATIEGIRFANVYCPQGQSVESDKFPYKLGFYDGLCAWVESANDPGAPLVIMGDLNVAPDPDDVWDPIAFANTPSFHPLEHERFRRLLGWGLTDVVKPRLAPSTFSFWDYRGGDFRFNHGMRIDHVLATKPVADRVEQAEVMREWRKKKDGMTPSDHAPVAVRLGP